LKEEIESKNQGDKLGYHTEKQMEEMKDKIAAEDKSKIEAALGRLKEAQKANDVNEMKSAIDAVNSAWNEAAQKMYAQGGAQGQPGAGAQGNPMGGASAADTGAAPQDEAAVEDADYEVVDDDKK
jgi:molecular chaperone DnaK